MLEQVRTALRFKTVVYDDEIQNLISACLLDLKNSGITTDGKENDPLIVAAVILFCKARFGFDNSDAARFEQSYFDLKVSMANSSDYGDVEEGSDS